MATFKNKPLTEQVAVVTGGGTGIGRAFAAALAGAGARAVVLAAPMANAFILFSLATPPM